MKELSTLIYARVPSEELPRVTVGGPCVRSLTMHLYLISQR
jgi:hypothetical protein